MLADYRSRSSVLEAPDVPLDLLRARPLDAATVRAFRYMEGVESYTLFYLQSLLATRAAHEAEIASFLAGWLYEETGHGLAIAALLEANGTPIPARSVRRVTLRERITAAGTAWVSRCRSDFAAVHMLWGAINELTALTAYRRLARRSGHPAVIDLCARLARDEARHFAFYFEQARRRLAAPRTQRLARRLVMRFWAPVGSGVEPASEVRFLVSHLFGDAEGRAAARRLDERIETLPGLGRLRLIERWLERHASCSSSPWLARTDVGSSDSPDLRVPLTPHESTCHRAPWRAGRAPERK